MKSFKTLKKIIALSIIISLVPSTMQAAWYDNLWKSVKENAVAIASVAAGAAAVLGTLWFKKTAAAKPDQSQPKPATPRSPQSSKAAGKPGLSAPHNNGNPIVTVRVTSDRAANSNPIDFKIEVERLQKTLDQTQRDHAQEKAALEKQNKALRDAIAQELPALQTALAAKEKTLEDYKRQSDEQIAQARVQVEALEHELAHTQQALAEEQAKNKALELGLTASAVSPALAVHPNDFRGDLEAQSLSHSVPAVAMAAYAASAHAEPLPAGATPTLALPAPLTQHSAAVAAGAVKLPEDATPPTQDVEGLKRYAAGCFKQYDKLKDDKKDERLLQSYQGYFTNIATRASAFLVMNGVSEAQKTELSALLQQNSKRLSEVNERLQRIAEMNKSTASLQPMPENPQSKTRADNTQRLVQLSAGIAASSFEKLTQQTHAFEKEVQAHLETHKVVSENPAHLEQALQTNTALCAQAKEFSRQLNFLQDRWEDFSKLTKTFENNLVGDKFHPIDLKEAYEYIDLDSTYAAQINAKVLHEYVMQTVIPAKEQLPESQLKDKQLHLLRQIAGYLFSNDVMKETYDAFIKGEQAFIALRAQGTQQIAQDLLVKVQQLKLALTDLEDTLKRKQKLNNAGQSVLAAAKPAVPAPAIQPTPGLMASVYSAAQSALGGLAAATGLAHSKAPLASAAKEESEPFMSVTITGTEGNGDPKFSTRGVIAQSAESLSNTPPAASGQAHTAAAHAADASELQPMVRTAVAMATPQNGGFSVARAPDAATPLNAADRKQDKKK